MVSYHGKQISLLLTLSCWSVGLAVASMQMQSMFPETSDCCLRLEKKQTEYEGIRQINHENKTEMVVDAWRVLYSMTIQLCGDVFWDFESFLELKTFNNFFSHQNYKYKNQCTDSPLWQATLNAIQTVHVQKELTQFNLLIVRKNLKERKTERKLFIHTFIRLKC